MNRKSQDNYSTALDLIIDLTNKPIPAREQINVIPLVNSTSTNLAVDLVIKYLTYFLNPSHSISQDITITKDGTAIRIIRDPLESIINHHKITDSYWSPFFSQKLDSSRWLREKFYWIQFLHDNIIELLIKRTPSDIKKSDLYKLLVEFYPCKEEIQIAVEDLYSILNNISIEYFISTNNIINPSFHHINESAKCFGTQADLILDKTLIDIKNTKEIDFKKDYYKQLLYYYMWSTFEINETCYRIDHQSHKHKDLEIDSLGIYYPRFNYLFKFKVSDIWKQRDGFEKSQNIFLQALKKR